MNEVVIRYEVECDKCGGKAMLKDINRFGKFGKKMLRYYCKKCKKIMYRWQ